MPDHPKVVEIIKEPHQTSNFGGVWHTDTCYLPQPPLATLLYACNVPEVGGDTVFANLTAAYEHLSPGLQSWLADKAVINSSALTATLVRGEHLQTGSMQTRPEAASVYEAEHPLVRKHPDSGRESLYLSPAHSSHFTGMTPAESAPLLNYLADHVIQAEFCCRFRWQNGSLALWDNRCTLHCAINDYDGQRRVMQRVTIAG